MRSGFRNSFPRPRMRVFASKAGTPTVFVTTHSKDLRKKAPGRLAAGPVLKGLELGIPLT